MLFGGVSMIIKPGEYIMRNGRIATVLAVIDATYEPVIGYLMQKEEGYSYPNVFSWELNGRRYSSFEDESDLIERIEE